MAEQRFLLAEQQNKIAQQKVQTLQTQTVDNLRWARKLNIAQEIKKFPQFSDKRAMTFLMHESFDLQDMEKQLAMITPVDPDEPFITPTNHLVVEEVFSQVVKHLDKRSRKNRKEIEDFFIAKEARFAWKATKNYNDNSVFKKLGSEQEAWEVEELSTEKLCASEQSIKRTHANQKVVKSMKFNERGRGAGPGQGGFRFNRSSTSNFTPYSNNNTSNNNFPRKFVPQGERSCNYCHAFDHLIALCPKRPQKLQHK